MKTLFAIIAAFIVLPLTAQTEKVIEVDLSKDEIYSKSLVWIAETWKNSNEVIQMKDKEVGKIILKGGLTSTPKSMGVPAKGNTSTQVTIDIKEGKSRIRFENTNFEYDMGTVWTTKEKPKMSGKAYDKWIESLNEEYEVLIDTYEMELKENDDF